MSLKLRTIFIFNILLMSSVLSQEIMSKYGSKKSYTGDVFLDVSGFNSGDKIYITVTTHDYCYNTYLEYKFYASFTDHSSYNSLSQVSYTSETFTTTNGISKKNIIIK